MKRSGGTIALLVAGALLLGLLVAGFLSLERVERTIRLPPQAAARNNPFLAAQRFLDRMGLEADSRRRLLPLPETDRLLVLGKESRLLTSREARQVLDWVAAGGHLLIGPHLEDGQPVDETYEDPLLEGLGVGVFTTEANEEPGQRSEYRYDLDESGDPAEVRFYDDFGLAFLDDEEERTYGIVYDDLGEGRFYVINDTRFLRNEEIGDLDHARLLWDIVRFGRPRAGALIVYGQEHESLLSLTVRHAWPAMLAGLITLTAFAWRRAARFGPLLPPPFAGSRSLMDHIDAAGHFLWRQRRGEVLLESARRSLMRKVLARRPQLHRLSEEQRAETLASDAGMEPDVVRRALVETCPHRRDAFTRRMRTVETLRRTL